MTAKAAAADLTALTSAITAEVGSDHAHPAYVLTQGDYTGGSWTTYSNAIDAAITVEGNGAAVQSAIDSATGLIGTTKTALVFAGKTDLDTAKATAAGKVQADYTSASWSTLTTALGLAETTNALIVTKTTAINGAIAALTTDKTALTSAITAEVGSDHAHPAYVLTQGDYTGGSWTTYSNAIDAAITVEGNGAAVQSAIDSATGLIGTTKTALVFAGKTDLDTAKATAAGKVQADYTSASWTTLTNALALAETTNAEVVTKTTAINAAIAALVKVVTGITVTGAGDATTVDNGGTLQMGTAVLPGDATDPSVVWSVVTLVDGTATIDPVTGVLAATGVGTVTVTATANDASGVVGQKVITITVPLTVYVNDSTGNNSSNGLTADTAKKTIQAGIAAVASGGTVHVANGTYHESLTINESVTIDGNAADKSLVIIHPDSLINTGIGHHRAQDKQPGDLTAIVQAGMFINGAAAVTLKNMTVDGNSLTPYDAIIFWNGSSGTIDNLSIGSDATFVSMSGHGLAVDALSPATVNLEVKNSIFTKWNRDAIHGMNGNGTGANGGNMTINVTNTIFEGRSDNTGELQNGINLWNVGGGVVNSTIDNVTIRNLTYDDGTWQSYAIAGPDNSITVKNSTLTNVKNYLTAGWGNGVMLDARENNTFDGINPSVSATPAQLFAIEDMNYHKVDEAGWGFVNIKTGNVYVTQGSGSIQRGIAAATSGDIINVAAGTYNENQIIINKAVTIQGAGIDSSTIDGGSATNLTGEGLVRITASGNVKFDGFTLQNVGVDPTKMNAGTAIRVGIYVSSPSGTYTISNNKIIGTNNSNDEQDYGFYASGGNEDIVFSGNTITKTGANAILVENHQGPTNINGNTLDEGAYGSTAVFVMNHDGVNVTTSQKVTGNTINVGTGNFVYDPANPWTSGGITFSSAFKGTTGTFTNVKITDNTITNLLAHRRGISLVNNSSNGTAGEISNFTITGNTVTGTNAVESIGIKLSGLMSNGEISGNSLTNLDNGLAWDGASLLDATSNWWGSAVLATVASKITGTVTFEPYFTTEDTTITGILSNIDTITSSIGTVNDGASTITNIPFVTTLADFKAGITPATGATFDVYDANGTDVAVALSSASLVKVTSVDGTATKTYTVSVNLPIMTGTVAITGTEKFGSTLTAVPSLTNSGTPTYQWKRGGSDIGSATASTYTLVLADIGSIITVTATADGVAGTGSITSAVTGSIAKADGPTPPAAPTAINQGTTSITLAPNGDYQFNRDGGTYQDDNTFGGLSDDTEYTFTAIVRATDTTVESVASAPAVIKTDNKKSSSNNHHKKKKKVSQTVVLKKVAEFAGFRSPAHQAAFRTVSAIQKTNPTRFRAMQAAYKKYVNVSGQFKPGTPVGIQATLKQLQSYNGYSIYLKYLGKK